MDDDYPIVATNDGIVIKTEKMKVDKIYHCIHQNKVFLFFKDEQQLLNCYEVEDAETAEAIKSSPDSESIKSILEKVAKKQQEKL
ncbi:MAG: hypothetical protein HMLIMOIP_000847 [Candidatus Nitrosomirales archaeon]|jgi:hypothetical protein